MKSIVERLLALPSCEDPDEILDAAQSAAHEIQLLQRRLHLTRQANKRAIELWQKAHPDKALILPDQADIVAWLIEQHEQFETRLKNEHHDWLAELNHDTDALMAAARESALEEAALRLEELHKNHKYTPKTGEGSEHDVGYCRALVEGAAWIRAFDPAVSQSAVDLVAQARRDALIGPLSDIAAERQRQQQAEGWTVHHDDMHTHGEMARAAACYALHATAAGDPSPSEIVFVCNQYWPWDYHWWKPKDARRDLIRAAALILAEIERLDRAAAIRALKGKAMRSEEIVRADRDGWPNHEADNAACALKWRETINNRLTSWMAPIKDGEEPHDALLRLLEFEQRAFNDPAVSESAADLVAETKANALREAADLCDQLSEHTPGICAIAIREMADQAEAERP
jgi:hypothetical protein